MFSLPVIAVVLKSLKFVCISAAIFTVIVPLYFPSGLAVISNEPVPSSPYFDELKLLTVTLVSKSDICEFRLINA